VSTEKSSGAAGGLIARLLRLVIDVRPSEAMALGVALFLFDLVGVLRDPADPR
jgi:hypothetical protein